MRPVLWLFEQVREWRERKLEVMRLESELVERERRNYLRELEEHEREEKERRQQQKQQVRAHDFEKHCRRRLNNTAVLSWLLDL